MTHYKEYRQHAATAVIYDVVADMLSNVDAFIEPTKDRIERSYNNLKLTDALFDRDLDTEAEALEEVRAKIIAFAESLGAYSKESSDEAKRSMRFHEDEEK